MARLKLNPDPTFKAKVAVPVPGGSADIECTFKYRDRNAAKEWMEAGRNTPDVDALLSCLEGWDLDDEFSRENVQRLCDSYPRSAEEIIGRYLRELAGIRQGN